MPRSSTNLFTAGYRAGRTPNPCVICNGELRIDAMLDLACRLGRSALATGHYAGVVDDGDGPLLRAAADAAKDQTYMLSAAARLAGAPTLPARRAHQARGAELAAAAGLPVASKAESQDLCFLAGEGKRPFLARHGGLAERPGAIVDRGGGRRLGEHRGHHEFTVGQRRGFWGRRLGAAVHVLRTDAAANEVVVVGTREELARRRAHVARRPCIARGRTGRPRAPALPREAARLRAPASPRR